MKKKMLNYGSMVKIFSDAAICGLQQYYNENSNRLPYTTRLERSKKWNLHGHSIRYAAICQIGIHRWLTYHPEDKTRLPNLWPAILTHSSGIQDIGDAALCLWAAADSNTESADRFAGLLAELWPQKKQFCNAVELGWVVQAGTLYMKTGLRALKNTIQPILDESHGTLKTLFRPQSGLFQRHCRGGRFSIGKQVACFADQVYPILAMTTYGQICNDKWSKDVAVSAVESICKYQGALGQWMWHYDVEGGKVCEEYPVFSVHQHAMAPMCILACDKANQIDHRKNIQLGMRWLFGENELSQNLVCEKDGIIWRDIERNEPLKISRFIRGLCCVCGLDSVHHRLKKSSLGYKVNYECRPYELGWILYAWACYKPEA